MDTLLKLFVFTIAILTLGCACPNGKTLNPQIGEMDMIRNAQDLTKEEQEKLVDLYRSQEKKSEANRSELMRLKAQLFKELLASLPNQTEIHSLKAALLTLQSKETAGMIDSLEKVAEVARSSKLDKDYLIRAFLREHRRTIENFPR